MNSPGTAWFGFVDTELSGALLLYSTEPFAWLRPNSVVFGIEPDGAEAGLREDHNAEYASFKQAAYPSGGGDELVAQYNAEDIEVYAFARRLYCARVRESGLVAAAEGEEFERHFKECRRAAEEPGGSVEGLCGSGAPFLHSSDHVPRLNRGSQ